MRSWLWLSLIAAAPAWACSCGPTPSVEKALETSPLIFDGQVVRVDPVDPHAKHATRVHVRVLEAFKGARSGDLIELEQNFGGGCGWQLAVNQRLLFYLNTWQPGILTAIGCNRTKPISEATDDLAFLRRQPAPAGARLSGTIIEVEKFSDRPLPNVRIRLGHQLLTTGPQGGFQTKPLPAGRYSLTVELPAGLRLTAVTAIGLPGLAPKQTQLPPAITLDGRTEVTLNIYTAPR